jgi:hypothetical protein
MKHIAIRTVGQFQLMEDKSAGYSTYYIENTILTKHTKSKGKSYNFEEDKKETLMLVDDAEFVSRAKQRAGNDLYILEVAQSLWSALGDIPVNEDDELDADFVNSFNTFEKGECKFEVWHWFENTFNLSVAKDLMNLD